MFGLLERDIDLITRAIKHFDEIDSAKVYGSRASGNYQKGSDVDIAIIGKETTRNTVVELSDLLNEQYPLPYFFDIVHYDLVTNDKLARHIDDKGVKFYEKEAMLHEDPQKHQSPSND